MARQISGTGPSPAAVLLNSPKTANKLKNGHVTTNNNINSNSRVRSKEPSPELVEVVSLEKRILDAIVLLGQNQYNVLDGAQQREASAKLARIAEMEGQLQVQSRGVEALGVLVNYLVHDVSIYLMGSIDDDTNVWIETVLLLSVASEID